MISVQTKTWMLAVVVAVPLFNGFSIQAADVIRFNRDIRPILSEHCFECHGPDAATRQAELRLDLEAEAKQSAIVAGQATESPLWERVSTADPDLIMPPPEAQKPLNQQQIERLRLWLEQGADYQQHWSFLPIARPSVPASENPIDYFVRRRLQQQKLSPSPPADPLTLLRRVTLDLTGLPPTPDQTQDFLADKRPDAYERLVERLLASPHYGEHMAVPWLEAARYADTSGYQADWERFMWPWRDWVINAFNTNLPFDRFTIEQLAGDMLPDADQRQILATGFNRNHRINDEAGVIDAEYAVEYVVDRIDTTSTVWLGLTMGCCRCHDHKYDPLPQQDFYNMFALFNNIPEKGTDGKRGYAVPTLDVPNPQVESQLKDLQADRAAAQQKLNQTVAAATDARLEWLTRLRAEVSAQPQNTWQLLKPAALTGTGGVTFEELPDGSYLRTGANPAKTTYSIIVTAQQLGDIRGRDITGIRLEALTHDSHTNGSLAASVNGNFVLSEVRAEVIRGREVIPVAFTKADADYSQSNYPSGNVIDGNPATGWAVDGQVRRENRTLVLTLKQPRLVKDGDQFRLQLQHSSQFGQHAIGRFRLGVTTISVPALDGDSGLSPELKAALVEDQPTAEQQRTIDAYFRDTFPAFAPLRDQLATLDQQIAAAKKNLFVKVMVMSEMETPRPTFVLTRGLYDQPDQERPATPDAPAVFGGLGDFAHNRLGFAQWLVSDQNPLTARVTVNRVWQQFWGRGLVETVEDFGSQGTPPTHPELLDWLAGDFRDNGWNMKRLVRQIVTSETYRQSSVVTDELLEQDPKNLMLARAPRVRLSGYQLRDQALAAAGLLVPKIGGPSVKPYQPPGLWSEVSFQDRNRSTDFYIQGQGDDLYRRGLYTFWKRSVAPPMLANFDAAGREMCTVRQTRTSTPLQALNLLNDVTFVEAAEAMAQRMLTEGGTTVDSRVEYGLRLLGLEVTESKQAVLAQSFQYYTEYFRAHDAAARDLLSNGEWQHDESLNVSELAALTAVASVLLNLDETLVRQ
ncbi:MAG: PSD1 and planctomycete cytochrome C domain-containing protein [Fuerstiella sp.]